MHKPGRPEVPELGGVFLIAGFSAGILTAIAFNTFLSRFLTIDLTQIIAVLSVVLIAAIIGIVDDLIGVRQRVKALLPLLISLPLVAISVGDTTMNLPFIGQVDFRLVYPLVLVPLGVTGAANAVNMLAGYNGVEAGVALVAIGSLSVIAWRIEETTALFVLLPALAALLATLYFNWYPAKVFVGDVGTLSIGAIMASAVIVGNFELAGVIIIVPYFIDFLIKASHRFPKSFAEYSDGKLFCPIAGPAGLGLMVTKLSGGISERNLTLSLMGLEMLCGAAAISIFW